MPLPIAVWCALRRSGNLWAEQAKAEKAEAAALLRARREGADRAIIREYPRALAEYEKASAALAEEAAKLAALDDEVDAVNRAIRAAKKADPSSNHPEPVRTSTERYRSQPDIVEPDREESAAEWFVGDRRCSVTMEHQGKVLRQRALLAEEGVMSTGIMLMYPAGQMVGGQPLGYVGRVTSSPR